MAEGIETLKPVVSRLQPENALRTFTDYSQWERRPTRSSGHLETSLPKVTKSKSPLTTASRTPPAILQPICKHGQGTKHTKQSPTVQQPPRSSLRPVSTRGGTGQRSSRSVKKKESDSVHLLRLQVATRQSSVEDYKKHKQELLTNNLSIIATIEQAEERTHGSVNELLEKYQKFKGAISTLKQKSSGILRSAREEFEAVKASLQSEIEVLRKRVSSTDASLQSKSREVQTLFHYKDKEYPIKLVHIEHLKEQIEILNERNESEIVELELEIADERRRCEQQLEGVRMRMEARATEASLSAMKRSVQQKAIHNRIMEKEILIHQEKHIELEQEVQTLRLKVRQLKQDIKKKNKQPIMSCGKCLPDTELQLNIPVQDNLPV